MNPLAPLAALVVGVIVLAGISRYARQHRLILAYREEVHELTNQIIELRNAQHDAGAVVGNVDWPARVIDEFRRSRLARDRTKQKETAE